MEPEQLAYTVPFQLTKTIRRDPYDALQGFSAAGKLIVITGAGSGIGAVSTSTLRAELKFQLLVLSR
jgi:hypothetical protein